MFMNIAPVDYLVIKFSFCQLLCIKCIQYIRLSTIDIN